MYLKYAKRYPRIYVEAFLANCMGIWYPDDTTHAHTMDSEGEWDFVYLKTGNIVPEIVGEVNAHSYLPPIRTWISISCIIPATKTYRCMPSCSSLRPTSI